MIRSAAAYGPRVARARNSRAIRDEHVAAAQLRIFGTQDNMPGDRNFRKKLEGKKLMRWYFPSKYAMQDFRADDYFEMQAERFAPREQHDSRRILSEVTRSVSKHRETLRLFFNQLDRHIFLDSPELQDLYAVFRLVDPDKALPFEVPELVFKDHGPMFSADAPFQTAGGRADVVQTGQDVVDHQQLALQALVLEAMGGAGSQARALELSAQLSLLRSSDEVREALLLKAKELNVVPSFDRMAVVLEELVQAAGAAKSAKAAAAPESPGADFSSSADPDYSRAIELLGERAGDEAADAAQAAKATGSPDADSINSADPVKTVEAAAPAEDEVVLNPELVKALADVQGSQEEDAQRGGQRRRILGFHAQPVEKAKGMQDDAVEKLIKGSKPLRAYVNRRHRFMDPMYRRRRLKWLERSLGGQHKAKELKYNSYYTKHPDDHAVFPTNKGSVTVTWPSPYH